MRLVPDSGSLREDNDCHNPKGEDGGQFCDGDGVPSGYKRTANPALWERADGKVKILGRQTSGEHGKVPRLRGPYRVFTTDGKITRHVDGTLKDAQRVGDQLVKTDDGSKKVVVRGLSPDIAAELPPLDTLRWVETGWAEARQTMLATSDSEDDTLSPDVTRDISVNGTVTYRLQKDGYPKRKTLALALSDYVRVRIGRRNERRVRDEAAKK